MPAYAAPRWRRKRRSPGSGSRTSDTSTRRTPGTGSWPRRSGVQGPKCSSSPTRGPTPAGTPSLMRRLAFRRAHGGPHARRLPGPRRRCSHEGGRAAPGDAPVLFNAFVSLQETAQDRGSTRRAVGWRVRKTPRPRGPIGVWIGRSGARRHRRARRALRNRARHAPGQAAPPLGRCQRDKTVMRPRTRGDAADDFRVFVYASFIPLHGLEHVVRAARDS